MTDSEPLELTIEDIYPLSPMQQGMLFHTLLNPDNNAYFEQLSTTLHGELDISIFKKSWENQLQRHSILRSSFIWEDLDEPLQVVYQQVNNNFKFFDWRNVSVENLEANFKEFLLEDRNEPFQLMDPPLMRFTLIQFSSTEFKFVWSFHHLLLDGWSLPLLLSEVLAEYENMQKGEPTYFPPAAPYRNYIAWLQDQDLNEAEEYWRAYLDGFSEPTPIVIDTLPQKTNVLSKAPTLFEKEIPYELSDSLRKMSQNHGLTLNTIFQGALSLTLHRYTGNLDIVFGGTVSGRPTELHGAEKMVGLFINTLPVRTKIDNNMSLVGWLKDIQKHGVQSRRYQYSPLVNIQNWSEMPRGIPLFDCLLVFENYPVTKVLEERNEGIWITDFHHYSSTNYPLTVVVVPGEQIKIQISHNPGEINTDAAKRMISHLEIVLDEIIKNPEISPGEIAILSEVDKKELLKWEKSDIEPVLSGKTVHQRFTEIAVEHADEIAVQDMNSKYTYRELDQFSNRIANFLISRGVQNEDRVAICMPKTVDLIACLLAILKSGGCYVPLDPNLPLDRISFNITDSEIKALITIADLEEKFQDYDGEIVFIDKIGNDLINFPFSFPDPVISASNAAYMIYTSGSTGVPKGVVVEHASLLNHITTCIDLFGIMPGTKVLSIISFSFDAAGEEIYPALLGGGKLVLAPNEIEIIGKSILEICERYEINNLILPAAVWHRVVDDISTQNLKIPGSIQFLLVGGEAPSLERLEKWKSITKPNSVFINGYGPTEATIASAMYIIDDVSGAQFEYDQIPIGKPLPGVHLTVRDNLGRRMPVGVPGELFIGGIGLARGYHAREDLTRTKFILEKDGNRYYRSGDKVVWMPDGNLYFLGRIDDQIKWRGYRIEPGEIEAVIKKWQGVSNAVVVLREDNPGDKRLVAYIIGENGSIDQIDELRKFMLDQLPEYMMPSFFVNIETLPLTTSGKVDFRSLPEPVSEGLERKFDPARNTRDEILLGLFADVLQLEKVGIHEDFFLLGGHSLLATQLVSRIRATFNVDFPMRSLFDLRTTAKVSDEISKLLSSEGQPQSKLIENVSRAGPIPVSYSQQRLWFIDQLEPGNLFYNIPMVVEIKGELQSELIKKVFYEIVNRHEVLRTSYRNEKGTPVQIVHQKYDIDIAFYDVSAESGIERQRSAQRYIEREVRKAFNLSEPPLLRAAIVKVERQNHIVVLVVHHIAADGWSMNILLREITVIYQALKEGVEHGLHQLPVQYGDYSVWQRGWLDSSALQDQLSYWKKKLNGAPPLLDLPTDKPRPPVKTSNGSKISFSLNPLVSREIKKICHREGVTIYMFLLASFTTLLYRYSQQDDISLGTAIANRTRKEVEGLIGFFVNTLVLRTDLSGDPSFRELLSRVRETTLQAFDNQDLPFEMLVDAIQPERNLSYTPLFQVGFDVQESIGLDIQFPGFSINKVDISSGIVAYDLLMSFYSGEEYISATIEFNTDLYTQKTIVSMSKHLETIISSIIGDIDQKISLVPLLTDEEKRLILQNWNDTDDEMEVETCFHRRFENTVNAQPGSIALKFQDRVLTYDELNRKCNQLARFLHKKGIAPDDIVGVFTDRCFETIISNVAVMKAGAAFLPLDPNYPNDRIIFMIEDASKYRGDKKFTILTLEKFLDVVPTKNTQVICVDRDWDSIGDEDDRNLTTSTNEDSLAYVIYTSGSTGLPKGTLLSHRGLVNLSEVQRKEFEIDKSKKVLQFSPLSFDASVWEMSMALGNGASLCLARQEDLSSTLELLRLMIDEGITTVTLPPSLLSVLPNEQLPQLSTIISAGEACSKEIVDTWAPGRAFYNAYGPTETTVCASMARCYENQPLDPSIGRPLANFKIFVVGPGLQPVPVGIPGELLVGGIGLAQGYLNRPELTDDKFIPNPFLPGTRLYRTGDLVRYRSNGEIEYLGRIDQQVKVRGFRIELGEIESVLRRNPRVIDAVAAVKTGKTGSKDNRLIAYIIPEQRLENSAVDNFLLEIKNSLGSSIPEYMIPGHFMVMEEFPLSPSGKIDRVSLPDMDEVIGKIAQEFVPPRNQVEESLTAICSSLLGFDQVGVFHNFFEMGGHSLLATQLISRVRDEFGVELPLRNVFEHPTIAELALDVEIAMKTPQIPTTTTIQPASRERKRMKRSDLN